jgi:DNA end-binding protein Ku
VKKDAMALTLMRYAEELVDTSEFSFPTAKDVRKAELQMARTLVENLADTWDPLQYTDEYRANLMKIIKAKMKGKEAHLEAPEEPHQAEVVDLMERLRQSLQGAGGGHRAAGTRPPKKPAGGKKPARGRKPAARGRARKRAA